MNPVLELDSTAGGVRGGLPNPKPTGFPILPLALLLLLLLPVFPNPPNGFPPKPPNALEGVVKGLSGEDVGLLNPPKKLVVDDLSGVAPPKRDFGVELLPKIFVEPPKREVVEELVLKVGVDFVFDGSDVDIDGEPNVNADLSSVEDGFELNSVDVEEFPSANVGAGGPVGEGLVTAGAEGRVKLKPLLGALLASDVGVNPPELVEGPGKEDGLENPAKAAGGAGIAGSGATGLGGAGVIVGAAKRTDGPGSGPSGTLFFGEFPSEPVKCLSHTFWILRRLETY